MPESVTLDASDLRMLAPLQEDGRRGNQELADLVRLSASQCSRRRLRLEESGVVRGYHAALDPAALGLGVVVFMRITLARHRGDNARRFGDLVRGLACVLEAHALTGDSDYLLKVVLPDLRSLSQLVNGELLAHESVAAVRSSVVLDTLKDSRALPLGRP